MWVVGVINCLVAKLEGKFLACDIMDNLSVLYPHKCWEFDTKESFHKHLYVIKTTFFHPKKPNNNDVWVLKVLLITSFDIQQYMFKLAMKSNACATMTKPFNVNFLTCS
jgi:hypothetical protein